MVQKRHPGPSASAKGFGGRRSHKKLALPRQPWQKSMTQWFREAAVTEKLRLGVNIDHVATIRNARGGPHPDPLKAARMAAAAGADGITAHLREDRRHISDDDIRRRYPDAPSSAGHGYGVVQGGGWLNLPRLIASWRTRLTDQGRFSNAHWRHADLEATLRDGWDAVIDCRGTAAADDPEGRIDIRSNRGEILTVQTDRVTAQPATASNHILNFGKWTLPLAPGQWRLGASYEWNRSDLEPTQDTAAFLMDALATAAPNAAPLNIIRHDVGLRPVSRDRRPAVGPWPNRKGLYVFNGLGTRGVLIGPRWSEYLCDTISGTTQPADTVSPERLIPDL